MEVKLAGHLVESLGRGHYLRVRKATRLAIHFLLRSGLLLLHLAGRVLEKQEGPGSAELYELLQLVILQLRNFRDELVRYLDGVRLALLYRSVVSLVALHLQHYVVYEIVELEV